MHRASLLLTWLLVASGCNKDSGGGTATPAAGSATAVPAKGSGGGFSADLAAQLDMGPPAGGSGSAEASGAAGSGSGAVVAAGSGAAGSGASAAGSGAVVTAGSGAGAAGLGAGAVGAAGSRAPAGSAAAAATAPATAGAAATGAVAVGTEAPDAPEPAPIAQPASAASTSGADPRPPVSVPSELKAIKISLLPNWERDVEAAGTISLRVKIPNRTDSAVFVFQYGYEAPSAPVDREAYKKWLATSKLLAPKDDRQAGGAWYIEGTDARGKPAFRFVVNYGGKKLVCYGSLYKDAASNALGDLRDQTILQAKQICETLAL